MALSMETTAPTRPGVCLFHSLPTEILLDIISSVPFTPSNFFSLRLTCRRFHDVLSQHERPIAMATRQRTFDRTTCLLFPGLEEDTLANLSRLSSRVKTLEIVHEQWLHITSHSPELEWLKGRFEGIHKAGLLLLYYLQDLRYRPESEPICDHCRRIRFLHGLPATSLACLLFKLISSVKILRVYGPEPIRETYCKSILETRSDVELACEELLLREGPTFFVALMRADVDPEKTTWAVSLLQAEVAALPHRQRSFQPPTLIASLRCALGAKADVDVRFTVSKMWELLASTGFDALEGVGGERMLEVVKGEEMEKGMRRIF